MAENSKIIVNQNDIFVYFEMIKRNEPKSILDIGMFLKRIGAISRQAMEYEIPQDILLDGIDIFPEFGMSVYEMVFNKIKTIGEITNQIVELSKSETIDGEKYDLAMLMRLSGVLLKEQEQMLWMYALTHSKLIFSDAEAANQMIKYGIINRYMDVSVDENHKYALVQGLYEC